MIKAITVVAAIATAAAAFTSASQPAQARDGGAVAAGVVGGLAAGAIIGSAVSQPRSYYAGPSYATPYYTPTYGACHWERERIVDGYGRMIVRRVRVCD